MATAHAPFDTALLDRLMDEAGLDVLLATSKHNVQYLLGGHRAFFFDYMDAIGVSRYLPVVVYPRGAADKAAFFGHRLEEHQCAVEALWTPQVRTASWGSGEASGPCLGLGRRDRACLGARRQDRAGSRQDRRRNGLPAGRLVSGAAQQGASGRGF